MQLTNMEWAIVAGVLALILAAGLWKIRQSSPPDESRERSKTFLWGFAAVVSVTLAVSYSYAGGKVLAIHWAIVAIIAGWALRKRLKNPNKAVEAVESSKSEDG